MTKKTTTKKSGTIAYQLRRQNDLTGTATEKNPQMAVTVVKSKLTTTKELAEYINFACSVTESDVVAVLQAMRGVDIVSGGPTPNKRLTDEVLLRRVAKYLDEHEHMQRRNFESVCECSRYTATKKLKELVNTGTLRAMGAKNMRFYVRGSL